MVSKEILKKLSDDLPRGSSKIIRERLLLRGLDFSISYINYVLEPEDSRTNLDILNEAIIVRDEFLRNKSDIEGRILNPDI